LFVRHRLLRLTSLIQGITESIKNEATNVKRVLLLLIIAAVLAIGFLLYWSRSESRLNVAPDAAREIQKAKRR
jgi:Tfp pilus assembly protein PilO